MPNRLVNENSPYLLQHAENPVDWYPWGQEALDKARLEDKPIFLSIGYAACHWCHVMAHESFEDPQIAEVMNEHYVNVKVDREERPDLDSIYMNAVVALTGQGGWPMSVFLTPEGEPFFGGTYFPPFRRANLPSFKEILLTFARLWQEDREKLINSGEQLASHLKGNQFFESQVENSLDPKIIEQVVMRLAQTYDWKYGGWGQAPKFPQPMAIEFLLRRANDGDRLAVDVAVHGLDAMSKGGMYDVVGGGFARYSTDNEWLVPHFEKMLYDNALLARVYLYAYLLTRDNHFLDVCKSTFQFIQREMISEEGGFYSSLDADSEGVEGKYYLWSFSEIVDILRQTPLDFQESFNVDPVEFIIAAYGISKLGNFEGQNILQREMNDQDLSEKFGITVSEVQDFLQGIHLKLLKQRNLRVRPGTDDKSIVSWNAMTLQSFAEAARYLGNQDYLQTARNNASFLLSNLLSDDRLRRSWRDGVAKHNAFLEDHASLILALLALYQTDHDLRWYKNAQLITEIMIDKFIDPSGGFFDTSKDHETLLYRPKDIQDNATPSGNSLATRALLQMAAFTGRSDWWDMAEKMMLGVRGVSVKVSNCFSNWLCAVHNAVSIPSEIALLWPDSDESGVVDFERVIWGYFRPNLVLAASPFPVSIHSPPLLHNRPLLSNLPTAYVCSNFVCTQPVNSVQALAEQLAKNS